MAKGRAPQGITGPETRVAEVAAAAPAAPPAAAPPAPAPAASAPAATRADDDAGIEERIAIAASPDAVWAALSDLRAVAACLPGAELVSQEGERVAGRMRVALGPIKVAFAGEGTVRFDDAARAGTLKGQGRDNGTGSSASGTVAWQVAPDPRDAAGSLVTVRLSWRLTGALAQFNRAGLVQDLVRRLAASFAANLQSRLAATAAGKAPPPPAEAKPLGLFALLWSMLKARLLGR
ncbi:SRPBCC family protein [Roseomonas sp. NAR14]|uniref:SRPBCC family protein n=1 Tax=Roseomonas acroporae TaxID=2937791 RepID=A0A9X1YDL9_9PROT|nr:SRPBCC family protein [Roseomonas acroporae]